VIDDKAKELGRLLGQTDEYKAVKRARDGLDEASEIRAQMQRLEMLSQEVEKHLRQQQDPPKNITDEYEQLMSSIQAHPKYQQYVAAQSNFEKIMLRVNEQIMEGIKQGSESPIIVPG
jgi:cell fate (sporulation/competence/biofilm development) regulator YlbF (YheA/YmcA/DUF963 family)